MKSANKLHDKKEAYMEKEMKAVIIVIGGFLSSILGRLYVPILVMLACNLIDYATGLMAAKYRQDGGISSYRALKGVFKKVAMYLLVCVGAIMDYLISYSAEVVGETIPMKFLFACVVTIWLICNELISILENMIDIGVAIPPFLMPIVKQIKRQTEDAAKIDDTEDDDGN
jgi:toxin secretion/phage lysis holin